MPTLFFCAQGWPGTLHYVPKSAPAPIRTYVIPNSAATVHYALRKKCVSEPRGAYVRTGGLTTASLRTYVRAADGQWHYVRTYARTGGLTTASLRTRVRTDVRTYVLAFATGTIMTEARTHRILKSAKTCSGVHLADSLARTGPSHVL